MPCRANTGAQLLIKRHFHHSSTPYAPVWLRIFLCILDFPNGTGQSRSASKIQYSCLDLQDRIPLGIFATCPLPWIQSRSWTRHARVDLSQSSLGLNNVFKVDLSHLQTWPDPSTLFPWTCPEHPHPEQLHCYQKQKRTLEQVQSSSILQRTPRQVFLQ